MLLKKGIDELTKVNPFHGVMILSPVKPGKQGEIIDQVRQILRPDFDGVVVTAFFLLRVGNAVSQPFHIGFDGCKRRAQIMGDTGEKLLFCFLIFFLFLHGIIEILDHLIKFLTGLSQLILLFTSDAVRKIAVLHLTNALG